MEHLFGVAWDEGGSPAHELHVRGRVREIPELVAHARHGRVRTRRTARFTVDGDPAVGNRQSNLKSGIVHYLLFYDGGSDYEERRRPFRAAHLEHARAAAARGELVLGGAFANPI